MKLFRIVCWVIRTGHVWTYGPPEIVEDPNIPFEYVYCMRCGKRKGL